MKDFPLSGLRTPSLAGGGLRTSSGLKSESEPSICEEFFIRPFSINPTRAVYSHPLKACASNTPYPYPCKGFDSHPRPARGSGYVYKIQGVRWPPPSSPVEGTASLCVKRGSMATPGPRGGSDPFKGTGYEHSAPSLAGGGHRTLPGRPPVCSYPVPFGSEGVRWPPPALEGVAREPFPGGPLVGRGWPSNP